MRSTLYILTSCFFVSTIALKAQKIKPISKTEVLTKVLDNNTTIQISEQEFKASMAEFNQTRAVYLPNITASYKGVSTTNPLMAFGSKLNQGILVQNDFNPALLNNPAQTQNFATVIKIEQPLINLDGFYKRKAAKSSMQAMSLKHERTIDYLVFEAEKGYMQLQLALEGVAVLEKTLQASEANKVMAKNSFKQGYLQRADVLSIEIRVTEVKSQLQNAKSNVQNASNYLSFLMDDKSGTLYEPKDSLSLTTFSDEEKTISKNRADIKAMQFTYEAYEQMNKADKMNFLPRLNAFGSYEMYDNTIFQGNASGYAIGAQLSWDVFQGSKRFGQEQESKAVFEKSKLEYNQYVSKSNLELNKVKRQLADAKNRLELTNLAVEQSEESLRIRKNRFKEGLEKTADLLTAETQYAQKQLEYYQIIFEYNFTQTYLEFLTKE
jgi:outer membrane protein TolC